MRYPILIIFLFPLLLVAQPFQGQKFIGGSLDFSDRAQQNDSRFTSVSISPLFGGMLTHRFAIGTSFTFGYSEVNGSNFTFIDPFTGLPNFVNNDSNSTRISVDPFVAWYFPITGKLGFSLLTGVGWGYSKSKFSQNFNSQNEVYLFSARLTPSLYYFVNNHLSVTAAIGGLTFARTFSDQQDDVTSFDVSIRSIPTLGIRYFWEKAEEKEGRN